MPKVQRAINSFLSNKAGEALGRISNPHARDAAGRLINAVFPGFAGGVEGYGDNAFVRAQLEKARVLNEETAIAGALNVRDGNDQVEALTASYDWRARLRPKTGGADRVYGLEQSPGLLSPLRRAGGLIWQTTPNIFLTGFAEYNQAHMQGMNYPIYTYLNSQPPTLPITADFYANDIHEGQYLLAVMHFLKVITKGHFGDSAVAKGNFGTPPPVLVFEYLGDHGFNKVPVIVKDYSYQLPDDVDYVPVISNVAGGSQTTYIPTRTSITINLIPSYTPHKLRKRFDLDSLANGTAYRDGFI